MKRDQKARCENRSWELIYDDAENFNIEKLIDTLAAKKYGCYKAFAVKHTDKGKTHIHLGFIFRDKPRDLKWPEVRKYFQISNPKTQDPQECGALKNKSRSFDKKLQQYYDYCVSEHLHPGQHIGVPFLHKWTPLTEEGKLSPTDYITQKIRDGMTLDQYDELIDNSEIPLALYRHALKNYDVYAKMIDKHEEIRERKRQARLYKEAIKEYRPFQAGLTEVLDTQNDRNIHCHYDPGNTGKNYWLDREGMREDTLILQTSSAKRIAYSWNPRKHKRIIFDIPKHKMEFLNTSAIEKLKNGVLFSTMHRPKMKRSAFKPSIVIIGNEQCHNAWTEDRITYSTTTRDNYKFITKNL